MTSNIRRHTIWRACWLCWKERGANVEQFWPLVQFTIFAVQARYEEGLADLDEPLERAVDIENVRALFAAAEKAIAEKS